MTALALKLRKLAAELISVADTLQTTLTTESLGPWQIHRLNATATRGKKTIHLTPAENVILSTLLDNHGVCVERDELMSLLFGHDAVGIDSRTVDTHIAALRRKLGKSMITTLHGRGYRL